MVAIERDARTISRARARPAEAGLHNINFVQTDIAEYSADSSFDAAVGRCILQFVHDPVAALRSVVKQVRPDGVVRFKRCPGLPVSHFRHTCRSGPQRFRWSTKPVSVPA